MNELSEARREILAALDATAAAAVRALGASRREDPVEMLWLLEDSARSVASSLHGLLVAYEDLARRTGPEWTDASDLAGDDDMPF